MERQKIINFLNDSRNEESKFFTKKWYVIDSQTARDYNEHAPVKFDRATIKSSFCDYSNAYILVTGDKVNIGNVDRNNTNVAFKNCAPFLTCKTQIDDNFINEVDHIYIVMPMYN